jgi:hypothetical protein
VHAADPVRERPERLVEAEIVDEAEAARRQRGAAGLHARKGVAVEENDLVPALTGEAERGGRTGRSGADDDDAFRHERMIPERCAASKR